MGALLADARSAWRLDRGGQASGHFEAFTLGGLAQTIIERDEHTARRRSGPFDGRGQLKRIGGAQGMEA